MADQAGHLDLVHRENHGGGRAVPPERLAHGPDFGDCGASSAELSGNEDAEHSLLA